MPSVVPPEISFLDPDRIEPSDVGPLYIAGELLIAVENGVADPRQHVEALTAEFDGETVRGDDRLRLYQVRFRDGDEDIQELRDLRDEIDQLPGIEFATLHYLGQPDAEA